MAQSPVIVQPLSTGRDGKSVNVYGPQIPQPIPERKGDVWLAEAPEKQEINPAPLLEETPEMKVPGLSETNEASPPDDAAQLQEVKEGGEYPTLTEAPAETAPVATLVEIDSSVTYATLKE